MKLKLDTQRALLYKSASQKIRIVTEDWVARFVFCPNCGNDKIIQYKSNKPVADFYCNSCKEEYELKSMRDIIARSIIGGAYSKMIERITCSDNPNFFLLSYNPLTYEVTNFIVVPKYFLIPDIVIKRRPLSVTARRAGWTGCYILLNQIPDSGRIYFVKDGVIQSRTNIIRAWKRILFLRSEKSVIQKGWLLDIMRCVQLFNRQPFSLSDMYLFEHVLMKLHPENKHIKDKIRQQLQILRDKGYLRFLEKGVYKEI